MPFFPMPLRNWKPWTQGGNGLFLFSYMFVLFLFFFLFTQISVCLYWYMALYRFLANHTIPKFPPNTVSSQTLAFAVRFVRSVCIVHLRRAKAEGLPPCRVKGTVDRLGLCFHLRQGVLIHVTYSFMALCKCSTC